MTDKATLKDIEEHLYEINAQISGGYIALQKPIGVRDLETLNVKLGEIIKQIRNIREENEPRR